MNPWTQGPVFERHSLDSETALFRHHINIKGYQLNVNFKMRKTYLWPMGSNLGRGSAVFAYPSGLNRFWSLLSRDTGDFYPG